jgi:hypothetical protein
MTSILTMDVEEINENMILVEQINDETDEKDSMDY